MNRLKQAWKASWRIGLCLMLLAWIFHSIFINEASLKAAVKWGDLSRMDQWRVAWTTGPQELWRTLCMIEPGAFLLSPILCGVTILLGVVRWRMVLRVQGLELPLRRAIGISFVAQFFNTFLLGSTGGDLIKAYYAARETHHKKTEAVVTVFVDRLIGLWAMLMFAALMMIPSWRLFFENRILSGAGLMILGMFGTLSVVLFLAFWGGLSRRWPQARNLLRKLPKGEMFERSLDSCRQFGRHKAFLAKAVGLSLIVNTLVVVQFIVLAAGMGLKVSSLSLFLIVPIVTCIASMPITPSGLGLRENLFVMMLAGPGITKTMVLSLSLLAFFGGLIWSVAGGVVYLRLKEKQHLSEVTREENWPSSKSASLSRNNSVENYARPHPGPLPRGEGESDPA